MQTNRNRATHSPRALAGLCLVGLLMLPLSFAFGAETHAPNPANPSDGKAQGPPLFLEDTSPAGFVRTVDILKAEVKAGGWSLLAVHDMAEILAARGHTIRPVVILEVCSGQYSAQVLGPDETRYVASTVPCRVSVYQTSDGKVVISRMNTGLFATMLEPKVGEVIRNAGAEMEAIIARTLARLKQR